MNSREVMASNFKANKSLIKSMDFNPSNHKALNLLNQKDDKKSKDDELVSDIVSYMKSDKKYSKGGSLASIAKVKEENVNKQSFVMQAEDKVAPGLPQ